MVHTVSFATPDAGARLCTGVYDPKSNQLIIVGGCKDFDCDNISLTRGSLSDIAVLTNANGLGGAPTWRSVPLGGSMPGRILHNAVFDLNSNRITIFGGLPFLNTPALNETWVLNWAAQRTPSVTFGNSNAPVTTAAFGAPGAYTLRLSATDSDLTSSAETTVNITQPNGPPSVDAVATISISDPASATHVGRVSDDFLPVGSTITTVWSKISGPGTVLFANPGNTVTTAGFSLPGTYLLRLTANDSLLLGSADVTVIVNSTAVPVISSISPSPTFASEVDELGF